MGAPRLFRFCFLGLFCLSDTAGSPRFCLFSFLYKLFCPMIDTHTHIYVSDFDDSRTDLLARAEAAGVRQMLLPNIDADSIAPMMQLCAAQPGRCFPMMGLHPTELPDDPEPLLEAMYALLSAPEAPFVAVGEVGVDLYWSADRRREQIDVFRRQAEWAVTLGLPLSIHARNAHREIVDTLQPLEPQLKGGVFHCFGGTVDEARELLDCFPRFCLGIGGVVTFRKSALPAVLQEAVPLSRIVLETDAPYLAPHPLRGRQNEPALLTYVLRRLSEIYGLPPEAIDAYTSENARRVFDRLP